MAHATQQYLRLMPHAQRSDRAFAEAFDTIGGSRTTENGGPIDARPLSRAIASPAPRGWASLYATIRATRRAWHEGFIPAAAALNNFCVNDFQDAYKAFQTSGFRLRALLRSMVLSESF